MIGTLRQTLAADLGALDVPVLVAWPDRISPPCVIVVPPASASYITSGPTFGSFTVALDVVALVPHGSPSVALPALETLIEGVLTNSADWALNGVESPGVTTIGAADVLGTVIHLNKTGRI